MRVSVSNAGKYVLVQSEEENVDKSVWDCDASDIEM